MFEPKATAPHLDSTKTSKAQPEQMLSASPSEADAPADKPTRAVETRITYTSAIVSTSVGLVDSAR